MTIKFQYLLLFTAFVMTSCSNMDADADRACELMSETKELMPQIMKLSIQSSFGTETEMSEASEALSALEVKFEEIANQMEELSSNYDEDEFQNYLLENCEVAKELKDMGEALESIGDL